MLTQRMSRAAVFSHLDVEQTRHMELLRVSHSDFTKALAGLRYGDADLGLPVEDDAKVIEGIASVEELWAPFDAKVRGMLDRDAVTPEDIAYVAETNTNLLFLCDNVVQQIVEVYGNKDVHIGHAVSINVAGRQRMLSQKMAKEAGLIAFGEDKEGVAATLNKTADLFDVSLSALITGLPTVTLPAPPPGVMMKLYEVEAVWADYQPIIRRVANMQEAADYELAAIAAQADPLLKKMNDAVTAYEQLVS